MQKQKNLLPGLFLCVFSRTAEPLVDFIVVIYWLFPPLFIWGRLFLPERKVFPAPFIQTHFARRFHKKPRRAPTKGPPKNTPGVTSSPERALGNTHQKASRERRTFTARLYLACRRAPKAPTQKTGERAAPHQKAPCKNPGSNSRGFG